MVTNVYVDGFNLYYGCLKGSPYVWALLLQRSDTFGASDAPRS